MDLEYIPGDSSDEIHWKATARAPDQALQVKLFEPTTTHRLHIVLNMAALYQTGRIVERMFGSLQFLLLYLFSGLCGSMVSILWHAASNSAGASGAVTFPAEEMSP